LVFNCCSRSAKIFYNGNPANPLPTISCYIGFSIIFDGFF